MGEGNVRIGYVIAGSQPINYTYGTAKPTVAVSGSNHHDSKMFSIFVVLYQQHIVCLL